jgi:hypothetical protein
MKIKLDKGMIFMIVIWSFIILLASIVVYVVMVD